MSWEEDVSAYQTVPHSKIGRLCNVGRLPTRVPSSSSFRHRPIAGDESEWTWASWVSLGVHCVQFDELVLHTLLLVPCVHHSRQHYDLRPNESDQWNVANQERNIPKWMSALLEEGNMEAKDGICQSTAIDSARTYGFSKVTGSLGICVNDLWGDDARCRIW